MYCNRILFKNKKAISQAIDRFGRSYTSAVRRIIQDTKIEKIYEPLFINSAARILKNFKMTRQGPFKGLKVDDNGHPIGNVKKLYDCWESIEDELNMLKDLLNIWDLSPRYRTIILMDNQQFEKAIQILWLAFKKLLPITMGKHSYGLVGASKILFSVFPEIVLPVYNAGWTRLFKTVDLGDVIKLMVNEIREWESKTGQNLEKCDSSRAPTTLPAIYNVMAMEAR